jgi:Spy/CpxP family protein refolding chaperone
MKRLALWAVLALSLSANLAVAAVAVRQRGAAPPNEPMIFSRVALDAAQRARISALRTELMAHRDEHARRIADLRTQLATSILHEPADQAHVDSVLREIASSQAAMQRAAVDHVLAVQTVLRPDQRPAFAQMVAGLMRSAGPTQCGLAPAAGAAVNP